MAKSEFDQDVILYASARFWDENIRVHGREKDERFWVPNYPTPFKVKENEWRQCRTFEECEQAVLGTARYATFPRLGDWIPQESVEGWQFSERGRLTGYDRDLDLNLWKRPIAPLPNWDDIDMLARMDILRQLADSHGLI